MSNKLDTFIKENIKDETMANADYNKMADLAKDKPEVASVLRGIAQDEARHKAELTKIATGEISSTSTAKQRLDELIRTVELRGIKVEFVPPENLHDFAAMNWETAKKFDIKDFPANTVRINERYKMPGKTLEATEFQNLKHELDEATKIQNGEEYWQAHSESLKEETKPTVEIPKAERIRWKSQGGQTVSRGRHKAERAGSTPAPATNRPHQLMAFRRQKQKKAKKDTVRFGPYFVKRGKISRHRI